MHIPQQVGYRIKLCEQGMLVVGRVEVRVISWNELHGLCRRLGIADPSFREWRSRYGSLSPGQAQRLDELEREGERLPRLLQ